MDNIFIIGFNFTISIGASKRLREFNGNSIRMQYTSMQFLYQGPWV